MDQIAARLGRPTALVLANAAEGLSRTPARTAMTPKHPPASSAGQLVSRLALYVWRSRYGCNLMTESSLDPCVSNLISTQGGPTIHTQIFTILYLLFKTDPIVRPYPTAKTCSDGTEGVDGNGVVCCTIGCTQCGGPGCGVAGVAAGLGASDCCGGIIKASGVYCDDTNTAPCIVGSAP